MRAISSNERLSAFKRPSREKSIFLKILGFFSFKFFQGHNWVTKYSDSEFHGRWKPLTVSSRSPDLSEDWRFLAFWLSLCFGSFLLFVVCHDTAFLFSTRAMTALGWLPNVHREKCAVRSPYRRYHKILPPPLLKYKLGFNKDEGSK